MVAESTPYPIKRFAPEVDDNLRVVSNRMLVPAQFNSPLAGEWMRHVWFARVLVSVSPCPWTAETGEPVKAHVPPVSSIARGSPCEKYPAIVVVFCPSGMASRGTRPLPGFAGFQPAMAPMFPDI